MREIKFRAWDKQITEMTEVMCLNLSTYSTDHIVKSKSHPNGYNQLFENLLLMQYTGLKDKNGKEIFEGDIIRDNKDGAIGLVIYTPPMFTVKEKDKLDSDEYWNLGAGKVYPDNWQLVDTEIIGNIYSNSELLMVEDLIKNIKINNQEPKHE